MREKPRWGIVDLIVVYAGMIFFTLLLSGWSKSLLNGWKAARGHQLTDLQTFILVFFIQFLVTISLVLAAAVGVRGASIKSLGLRPGKAGSWIRYGLLGGLLITVFIFLAAVLIQHIHPSLDKQSFEQALHASRNWHQFAVLLIIGSVLAPFAEELFYRGMVYPVFRYHLGKLPGMLAAGAVFGAAHLDLWRALPLTIGGVFLCWIYEKSGSILVSALAHGVWNGLMAVVVYYSLAPA